MANRRVGATALSCLGSILLAGCSEASPPPEKPEDKPPLALMTTLPVYWPETGGFGELLDQNGERPWMRTEVERSYRLEPLDYLSQEALAPFDRLLLAQPRALSAEENVALDTWVRDGGQLLLFADPLVTMHSRYGLGDRRRPQAVALLSPILARWGLELAFDPDQGDGARTVTAFDIALPVDVAGTLEAVATDAPGKCVLSQAGHAARCEIGKGRVLAIADTAVLDPGHGGHGAHGNDVDEAGGDQHEAGGDAQSAALGRLLAMSFGQ